MNLCPGYQPVSIHKAWIMIIPNIDLQNNAMSICNMICMSSIVTYTQHRIYEFTSRILTCQYIQSMDNDYTEHRSTEYCNAYMWYDLCVQHSNLYLLLWILCLGYEFVSIYKVWIMIIPNIDLQNNALCVCCESYVKDMNLSVYTNYG